MTEKKIEYFRRPDPETEFESEVFEPKSVTTCCVCNTNITLCIPEQFSGYFVSSVSAQTVSYWFS
jgi:hypothetical protein